MDRTHWLDVAGKIALGVGGTALAAAGVLAAKSGAFQSAEARRRRNEDGRLIDAPHAGTPLLVSLAGVAEHSGVLNGGNPIAWLGVRESSRCFHYALTEDKVSRLRREGKLA